MELISEILIRIYLESGDEFRRYLIFHFFFIKIYLKKLKDKNISNLLQTPDYFAIILSN